MTETVFTPGELIMRLNIEYQRYVDERVQLEQRALRAVFAGYDPDTNGVMTINDVPVHGARPLTDEENQRIVWLRGHEDRVSAEIERIKKRGTPDADQS